MRLTEEHIGKKVRRVGNDPVEGVLSAIIEENSSPYKVEVLGRYFVWWMADSPEYGTWELVDPGLTLLEAMRSGRPFRPIGIDGVSWLEVQNGYVYDREQDRSVPIQEYMLTSKYELLEEQTVTVTENQFDKAWSAHSNRLYGLLGPQPKDVLKKALGFK